MSAIYTRAYNCHLEHPFLSGAEKAATTLAPDTLGSALAGLPSGEEWGVALQQQGVPAEVLHQRDIIRPDRQPPATRVAYDADGLQVWTEHETAGEDAGGGVVQHHGTGDGAAGAGHDVHAPGVPHDIQYEDVESFHEEATWLLQARTQGWLPGGQVRPTNRFDALEL